MVARRVEKCGDCGGGLVHMREGSGCPKCRTIVSLRITLPDTRTPIEQARAIILAWRDTISDIRMTHELAHPETRETFIASLEFVTSDGNAIQH